MPGLGLALALAAQDPSQSPLLGRWANPSRSVTVLISECGERLCATVESASDGALADAARAGTPNLVGTELLHGLVPAGPGRWKGRLFVPDLNRRSSAEVLELGPDRLKVRGCALGGLVCRSQTWSRINGPDPRLR
jgi:uncharacterized protein (DUF2147 family)